MRPKSAIVIGAGFAGLCAAIELARSGVEVTILEALDSPGGRAGRMVEDGYTFDLGPTLIVMTDVLRRTLGDEAFDELAMTRLEPGYEVRWQNGQRLEVHSDIALALAEVARYEGPMRSSRALRYFADVGEAATDAQKTILEKDHTVASFLRTMVSPGRVRPWVLGNLRRFTERYFSHPRVVEALTFQSLYLGTSPLHAPAMYALLPVSEIIGGVWYARGGTAAIVDACVALALRLGVTISYQTRVETIAPRATSVRVTAGDFQQEADAIVITADREMAMQNLFGNIPAPRERAMRYGHSAAVWYLGIERTHLFGHHTVLLPDDPWRAYAQLDAGRSPDDPLLYICNPVVTDASVALEGSSSLLVLAPVPNATRLANGDISALRERMLDRLEHEVGPLRQHIRVERFRGPHEFAQELALMHGAAFGPDHTLDQMAAFRPSIAHPHFAHVVFAGSGTRPGSGIPMVLISGRLAAERLLR